MRWRSFFLAGVAIAIQTLCPSNAIGELPADAPRWLRLVQYLIAVAIFCCFGAIASWIAFGPGERQFSGTHDRQCDDRCRDRPDGFRRRRGHHLALHRRVFDQGTTRTG
ncbi:MAG: hypothetical protein WA716_11445 [Pseudolabrys sp.]